MNDKKSWPCRSNGSSLKLSDWNRPRIVILPIWNTAQELIDYAHECCVVRELSPEDRVLYGLPPSE